MKAKLIQQPKIHVAIIGDDPLRLIGFRALLETEQDLELKPINLEEVEANPGIDVVLLSDRTGHNLADEVEQLKAALPGARVLVTGSGRDEDAVIQSITTGAKGYVSETASTAEFAKAIRVVNQGLIWACRHTLATVIDRVADRPGNRSTTGRTTLTSREKEVLKMLVAGRSNKEIAAPLGIEERTVKAHVAHLMRKLGVRNRITLSVHAVTHSIVAV